jgi:hypothetical protein
MPLVKHLSNLSELLTEAAYQRQLSSNTHISHSKNRYSSLKTNSVSSRDLEPSTASPPPQSTFPPSSLYRRILILSAYLDHVLLSRGAYFTGFVTFIALVLIAFETESRSSSDDGTFLILNSLINVYFGIEGLARLFALLARLSYPDSIFTPTATVLVHQSSDLEDQTNLRGVERLFALLARLSHPESIFTPTATLLISGLMELGTTLGSVICGGSQVGAWFRLLRVFFLSLTTVRHTAQLDVLMVPPLSPSLSLSHPLSLSLTVSVSLCVSRTISLLTALDPSPSSSERHYPRSAIASLDLVADLSGLRSLRGLLYAFLWSK